MKKNSDLSNRELNLKLLETMEEVLSTLKRIEAKPAAIVYQYPQYPYYWNWNPFPYRPYYGTFGTTVSAAPNSAPSSVHYHEQSQSISGLSSAASGTLPMPMANINGHCSLSFVDR